MELNNNVRVVSHRRGEDEVLYFIKLNSDRKTYECMVVNESHARKHYLPTYLPTFSQHSIDRLFKEV